MRRGRGTFHECETSSLKAPEWPRVAIRLSAGLIRETKCLQ